MAPRIVDKQLRRTQITRAAAEVFARKGFQGASVDDIAMAASSGPARERFAAVMENLYREFRGMTAGLIESGKAAGEFRADVDSNAVAAWLVGGLDGMMLQYSFDHSLDVQAWTEHFLELVWRGISTHT